jgi:hypothetical protein
VVDSLCTEYCEDYLLYCKGANQFFDNKDARGVPSRRLIEATYPKIPRRKGGVGDSQDDCEKACALYPRPFNPDDYVVPYPLGVNSIGDTFWCRRTHLNVVIRGQSPFAAQVHCPAASPTGGGVCANALVSNNTATPWEFQRSGASTGRQLGYCTLYLEDTLADCTKAGINDRTLPLALAQIPDTVVDLILNSNRQLDGTGITELPAGIFDNLVDPTMIESVFIDGGVLATIDQTAFAPLVNLEILSLNMNNIGALPSGMLSANTNLKEFSIYNTPFKGGLLTSVPSNLFSNTPRLERIIISGQKDLTELPSGLFAGLFDLNTLLLGDNGLTNIGMPAGIFNDLLVLENLDLSRNQFTAAPSSWFSSGWGVLTFKHISLYSNPIEQIDQDIFATLDALETAWLHDTFLISITPGLFSESKHLISYTLMERI